MGRYDRHASDDFPPHIGEAPPVLPDPGSWRARPSAGAVVMGAGVLILALAVIVAVGR